MCLIALHFDPDRDPWLVLAANRDEFHARPSIPMHWWQGSEGILAGRDEQAGGTWLGLNRAGRWAAVTNLRGPGVGHARRSRGALPSGFIEARFSPRDYALSVWQQRREFAPFNLLVGDRKSLWYVSSQAPAQAVSSGVHALSNGLLDAPWPKSRRVALALREAGPGIDQKRLLSLMNDRLEAPDPELPNTGVGPQMERFLSPPFIVSERYGTRCTTILAVGEASQVLERRWHPNGQAVGTVEYRWGPVGESN